MGKYNLENKWAKPGYPEGGSQAKIIVHFSRIMLNLERFSGAYFGNLYGSV